MKTRSIWKAFLIALVFRVVGEAGQVPSEGEGLEVPASENKKQNVLYLHMESQAFGDDELVETLKKRKAVVTRARKKHVEID
jgi:hypothetical protein